MNEQLLQYLSDVANAKSTLTDFIAKTFPVGSKVLVRTKWGWDACTVTWTPERSNGANPHIVVTRERTGASHTINFGGVGDASMVREA